MKIKARDETVWRSLRRLMHAVRALGLSYGFRWWKIETRCYDDPELVPMWIMQCDRAATEALVSGDVAVYWMLSSWSDLLRATRREWLLGGVKLNLEKHVKESGKTSNK